MIPIWVFYAFLISPAAWGANPSQIIHDFQMDEFHQAAPDFVVSDSHGKTIALKDYHGKAILLHFWASWCTPCQKELPALTKLSSQLDRKRWVFLPVTIDDDDKRDKALAFIRGIKPQVPFYSLKKSKATDPYITWGLPVTYLISPSGEIVARALGGRDWLAKPSAAHDLDTLFSDFKISK